MPRRMQLQSGSGVLDIAIPKPEMRMRAKAARNSFICLLVYLGGLKRHFTIDFCDTVFMFWVCNLCYSDILIFFSLWELSWSSYVQVDFEKWNLQTVDPQNSTATLILQDVSGFQSTRHDWESDRYRWRIDPLTIIVEGSFSGFLQDFLIKEHTSLGISWKGERKFGY